MATAADLEPAPAADVTLARAAVRAYLVEGFPSLPVDGGPAADLVVAPLAAGLAAVRAEAATTSQTLTQRLLAGEDPATLTAELAAAGLTQTPAAKASGNLAVSLAANQQLGLSTAAVFRTVDGAGFAPDRSYTLLPTGSTATGPDQVVLEAVGLRYVGVLGAVAVDTTAAGNRPAGTALLPPDGLPAATAAYAATDFTGGADAETAGQLAARLAAASEPATTASAGGLRNLTWGAAGADTAVAVVGFGHPGNRRALVAAGVYAPGRVDVTVRRPGQLGRDYVDVTATYVAAAGGYGVWQFTTPAAPGAAYAEHAYQQGTQTTGGGYAVTVTLRGYAGGAAHQFATGVDAAGSAYATVTGRFTDTDTGTGALVLGVSTRAYTVAVRTAPAVAAVQAAFDGADAAAAGFDVLARGPAAIRVTAAVKVTAADPSSVDTAAVAAAYAAAVNATGLATTLSGTTAAQAALAAAPAGATVATTGLSGTCYGRDATTTAVVGTDATLVAPVNVAAGFGTELTAFYCDANDVSVAT